MGKCLHWRCGQPSGPTRCGSKEKCDLAKKKFGYDECFNYHEITPDAGDHFDAALANLRNKGRVAVCGAISGYNSGAMQGNLPLAAVIYKQLRIEGFLCFDWLTGQRGNFLQDMSSWYKQGLTKPCLTGSNRGPKPSPPYYKPATRMWARLWLKFNSALPFSFLRLVVVGSTE